MGHRLSAGHPCGGPPVGGPPVAQVHYVAVWDGGGWYGAPLAVVATVSGPPVACSNKQPEV